MNTKITLNAIKLNFLGPPCYRATCGIFTWCLPWNLSLCVLPSPLFVHFWKAILNSRFIYLCIGRHPVQQVASYATTYVAHARSAARICIIELLSSKLMIIETGETSRPHNSWKDIIFMEIRIYTQPAAFYCHLSAINDSNDRLFTIYASNYFYILISKSVCGQISR